MTAGTAAETRKSWGARLRAERGTRTQEEIAAAVGIDQASVSRAETGGGSFETYIWLARYYGITLETPA
jgi:transcriptional regulator with XRE-family HTH domain